MKLRWLFLLLAALFGGPGRAATGEAPAAASAAAPAPAGGGVVYVIPVHGGVEGAMLYVIRRGLREAERSGARAIILSMHTPGGRVDAADEIVSSLLRLSVPTYTFVEKNAFSAGAIIALATDHIYMAPGSVIGDAMPIMMSPDGGASDMPEALQEKSESGIAALIRSAAQQKGHDPELAEKMVRRSGEFRVDDLVVCPTGRLLTLTNVEAEREVGADKRRLLSQGTVADVDELIEKAGLGGAEKKVMEVTGVEKIARVIADAQVGYILLMLGILGIYVEIKTPGLGLPGILGAICLMLFFWGYHIAGLAGSEEILLFVLGVALVVLEVFVFPMHGLLLAAGSAMMAAALLLAMIQYVPAVPLPVEAPSRGGIDLSRLLNLRQAVLRLSYGLFGAGVLAILLARWLPESRLVSPITLHKEERAADGFAAGARTADLLGREGVTLTPLRPGGAAMFGDRRMDVMARNEYVDAGKRVRVTAAEGSRVFVEAVPGDAEPKAG